MKTKTFLLLCLFLGIGLTQLSAQNGKNGTGTVTYEAEYGPWMVPVFCDGAISDYLTCSNLIVKEIIHFDNGEVTWGINKVETHEWTSVTTGEVYKGEAQFDHISFEKGYGITHGHLIGDKGNVLTSSVKIDTNTWEIIEMHTNCH